jgi:gluconate 2-dehydrogenase gamma chain
MSIFGRRRFAQLAGTATAAGMLASCARRDTPWRFLTAAEGRTLEALSEQIIPADEAPGARWAGVANYIDRQLMGPFRRQREAYRSGLAAIDQAALQSAGQPFAALDSARQAGQAESISTVTPFHFKNSQERPFRRRLQSRTGTWYESRTSKAR